MVKQNQNSQELAQEHLLARKTSDSVRNLLRRRAALLMAAGGVWLVAGCQQVEPISPGPGDPSLREVTTAPAKVQGASDATSARDESTTESQSAADVQVSAVSDSSGQTAAEVGDVVVSNPYDPRGDVPQQTEIASSGLSTTPDTTATVVDQRGTANPVAAVAVAVPASATNMNLVGPPAPVVQTVQASPVTAEESWAAEIIQRAAEQPGNALAQMDLQLLNHIKGRPVPDVGQLSSLSEEDRLTVMAVGDALSNFRSRAADSGEGSSAAMRRRSAFVELTERFSQQSGQLSIATLALCSKVDSYGVYEPMAAGAMAAGKETPVIVYVELSGFTSRLSSKQMWETKLTQTLTVFSSSGAAIWSDKPMTFVDVCRNRRKDFFLPRLIRLPAMPSGPYVLRVSMTDDSSGKVAEASVSIDVK